MGQAPDRAPEPDPVALWSLRKTSLLGTALDGWGCQQSHLPLQEPRGPGHRAVSASTRKDGGPHLFSVPELMPNLGEEGRILEN